MQASPDSKVTCNAFGMLAHEHQPLKRTHLIFQLIDVSIPNTNKMCGASHLVANEHKGLFDSKFLSINDFRLVVNLKLILHSEGEHTTKPNGLVDRDDLVNFDELIGCVGHTNNFVGNLPFQIFKADSNFIQYSSLILWQINKMCDDAIDGGTVLSSTALKICLNGKCHDGDVTRAAPIIFCDTPRWLIVEYILLIPNSAGAWTHQAQLPSPTKLNDDFWLVVKFVPILIFDGARAPLSMLIVGCEYFEISLHFCKDFRIFREGEWEVKDDGNAVVKQRPENSNYFCRRLPVGCQINSDLQF
jgi:hypothetical protein